MIFPISYSFFHWFYNLFPIYFYQANLWMIPRFSLRWIWFGNSFFVRYKDSLLRVQWSPVLKQMLTNNIVKIVFYIGVLYDASNLWVTYVFQFEITKSWRILKSHDQNTCLVFIWKCVMSVRAFEHNVIIFCY